MDEMRGEGRRMLVVDDEVTFCKRLEQFFTSRGFSVTCAFSGEEAIARLNEAEVDAVLVDILLPGIHGIEVLKRAKRLYPGSRVIMMTALEQHEELREQAARFGADGYVTKPFALTDETWAPLLRVS